MDGAMGNSPNIVEYHDYSMKCRDCHYTHYFGNAPLSCRTKASSHALRKMHTVDVRDSGRTIETVDPKKSSKPNLFDVDKPPF
jgi:hypothetical protein